MILGRSRDDREPQAPRSAGGAATPAGPSVIGHGMEIVGDLRTEGILRVEGRIVGDVRAQEVVVGRDGVVEGDITAETALVGGRTRGTVVARKSLELQAGSDVRGTLRVSPRALVIQEGARFSGEIDMGGEGDSPKRGLAPARSPARAPRPAAPAVPEPAPGADAEPPH